MSQFLGLVADPADLTAYSIPGVPFGEPGTDRLVLVGIASRVGAQSDRTIASATIAGQPATIVRQHTQIDGSNCSVCGFALAAVPAGTSGTVQVTFSGPMIRLGLAVYRLPGGAISWHDARGSIGGDLTFSPTIPAGGAAFGFFNSSGTTTGFGLTGLENDDTQVLEASIFGSGSRSFAEEAVEHPIIVTALNGGSTMPRQAVVIAWSPPAAPPSAAALLMGM